MKLSWQLGLNYHGMMATHNNSAVGPLVEDAQVPSAGVWAWELCRSWASPGRSACPVWTSDLSSWEHECRIARYALKQSTLYSVG